MCDKNSHAHKQLSYIIDQHAHTQNIKLLFHAEVKLDITDS